MMYIFNIKYSSFRGIIPFLPYRSNNKPYKYTTSLLKKHADWMHNLLKINIVKMTFSDHKSAFLGKKMQTASDVCSYRHFRVRTRSAILGKNWRWTPPTCFSTVTFLPIYNLQLLHLGTNCTLYIVHCTLFLVREMKRLVEERKMVNGESQLFSPCEEVNVVSSTFSRTEPLIANRKHLTQKIVSLRP